MILNNLKLGHSLQSMPLNWIKAPFINFISGFYISGDNEVAEFVSTPCDPVVWLVKNGEIVEGLQRGEFIENYKKFE